ncbi:hypothetical protein H1220_01935 [Carnobacteriaceae bacterium zg-84]|uniref:hypothetical protein n=1 Tax=Granulicatella sp. zg-84 TaxID=2678503 RepID=UPI0013BFC463|nr:hypothetical protein [Granulicatella sp. zg-84]NEW66842.1 hypothetical protein [Granulicatella sp. zg-84]QMI86158.1 hypothetical protein H1220_01935 [Carnobacteriaceae bacterium zg-84]
MEKLNPNTTVTVDKTGKVVGEFPTDKLILEAKPGNTQRSGDENLNDTGKDSGKTKVISDKK